jgi:TPP-dependent pyruvate/acetoin dehydrogenase alpha subunit
MDIVKNITNNLGTVAVGALVGAGSAYLFKRKSNMVKFALYGAGAGATLAGVFGVTVHKTPGIFAAGALGQGHLSPSEWSYPSVGSYW